MRNVPIEGERTSWRMEVAWEWPDRTCFKCEWRSSEQWEIRSNRRRGQTLESLQQQWRKLRPDGVGTRGHCSLLTGCERKSSFVNAFLFMKVIKTSQPYAVAVDGASPIPAVKLLGCILMCSIRNYINWWSSVPTTTEYHLMSSLYR